MTHTYNPHTQTPHQVLKANNTSYTIQSPDSVAGNIPNPTVAADNGSAKRALDDIPPDPPNKRLAAEFREKPVVTLTQSNDKGSEESPAIAAKRASNSQNPRKTKSELMLENKDFKKELAAMNARIEELEAELHRAKHGSPHTLSPEFLANQNGTDDITDPGSPEEYPLDLSDKDLRCVQPGEPLDDKVVNTVLHILVALAPCTVTAVNSLADIASDSTKRCFQALNVLDHGPVILVPIYIPPSGSAIGHWLLAVISSSACVRILDASPSHIHTEFAREKIKALFPEQSHDWKVIQEGHHEVSADQSTSDIDGGVAMLVNAIYIITESLGSEKQSVWREVLSLLLKAALGQTLGQTCDIPWAKDIDENTLVIDNGQVEAESMKQLWSSGPSGIVKYDVACSAITAQERYLSEQRICLESARRKKIEKRARIAGQVRHVYNVLQSLSEASLQQAKRLEVDKSCYEETLSKLEHSPIGVLFPVGHWESQPRQCLKQAEVFLRRRENMATVLLQVLEVLGGVVKALDSD
jgi:hypothetical protein